jgi:hypothetical protein
MKLMIEDLKDLIDWRTRMTVLVPLPIGQLKKKKKEKEESSVEIGTCQTDRSLYIQRKMYEQQEPLRSS